MITADSVWRHKSKLIRGNSISISCMYISITYCISLLSKFYISFKGFVFVWLFIGVLSLYFLGYTFAVEIIYFSHSIYYFSTYPKSGVQVGLRWPCDCITQLLDTIAAHFRHMSPLEREGCQLNKFHFEKQYRLVEKNYLMREKYRHSIYSDGYRKSATHNHSYLTFVAVCNYCTAGSIHRIHGVTTHSVF